LFLSRQTITSPEATIKIITGKSFCIRNSPKNTQPNKKAFIRPKQLNGAKRESGAFRKVYIKKTQLQNYIFSLVLLIIWKLETITVFDMLEF